MSKRRYVILAVLLCVVVGIIVFESCSRMVRVSVTDPEDALVPLVPSEIPDLADDLDSVTLKRAARKSLRYFSRLPDDRTFRFGPRVVSVGDIRATVEHFISVVDASVSPDDFARRLKEEFIWFEAAGRDIYRNVLFTGYYEPVLDGIPADEGPRGDFVYPLYRIPQDLITVDLGDFRESLQGERLVGRIEGNRLVPYHTRDDIDRHGVLEGYGRELVWLNDPIDRFILHIQGSGRVRFPDGRSVFVHYAGKNGHPYRSVGKYMADEGILPRDKVSMQSIRAYLRQHPDELHDILSVNPSYIFFRLEEEGPVGSLGEVLTEGRSIATDSRLFPKGGLAFVSGTIPVVDFDENVTEWKPFSRFVFNQDTGGAIRGAGRVDLYCGSGKRAERVAGRLRNDGRLFFLLKKPAGESEPPERKGGDFDPDYPPEEP